MCIQYTGRDRKYLFRVRPTAVDRPRATVRERAPPGRSTGRDRRPSPFYETVDPTWHRAKRRARVFPRGDDDDGVRADRWRREADAPTRHRVIARRRAVDRGARSASVSRERSLSRAVRARERRCARGRARSVGGRRNERNRTNANRASTTNVRAGERADASEAV